MAKFEKFDAGKQISGLVEAAWQIAKEERERQKTDEDVKFDFGHNSKTGGFEASSVASVHLANLAYPARPPSAFSWSHGSYPGSSRCRMRSSSIATETGADRSKRRARYTWPF